jgi:hypothetical protein
LQQLIRNLGAKEWHVTFILVSPMKHDGEQLHAHLLLKHPFLRLKKVVRLIPNWEIKWKSMKKGPNRTQKLQSRYLKWFGTGTCRISLVENKGVITYMAKHLSKYDLGIGDFDDNLNFKPSQRKCVAHINNCRAKGIKGSRL